MCQCVCVCLSVCCAICVLVFVHKTERACLCAFRTLCVCVCVLESAMSDKNDSASFDGDELDKVTGSRRMSWIGVDYFQALRHENHVAEEEFRRIPSHVNNILCIRYSTDGKTIAAATADGSIGVSLGDGDGDGTDHCGPLNSSDLQC